MIAAQSAKESSNVIPPLQRETLSSVSSVGSLPTCSGDEGHSSSYERHDVSESPEPGTFSAQMFDEEMPSPVNFYDCNINCEDNKVCDYNDENCVFIIDIYVLCNK